MNTSHAARLALVLGSICAFGAPASGEVRSFACAPGDTLVIQNDYGQIRVRAWDGGQLEARIQRNPAASSPGDQVQVHSGKSGSKIFLYAFFSGTPGESVRIDVQAPKFMNLIVWGANPEVRVSGMQGYVRVQTLTGSITGEDLIASVSLISDQGSLFYRAAAQPRGDARLESNSGTVRCELERSLNLRAWVRAGGSLSWNGEPELQAGWIEKQLGAGGPLLYAGSLEGTVEVRLPGVAGAQLTRAPESAPGRSGEAPRIDTTPAPGPSLPELSAKEGETPQIRAAQTEGDQGKSPSNSAHTSEPVSGGYTFKVSVRSVYLNVSVRDRATNRSVPHLSKSDFLVYEDGVLQEVAQLASEDLSFNQLLLLDVSGSTSSYIDLIRAASIEFTRQIKSSDRIAVAVFNSQVRLVRDFTGDRRAAAEAIGQIRSGGGTAFYDALETCVDRYLRRIDGRKAIVVFTDGVDNQLTGDSSNGSRTTFEQLYRKVQEEDAIIYTIFLDTEGRNPGSRRRRGGWADILGGVIRGMPPAIPSPPRGSSAAYEEAREQLQAIADQTGGRMYAPRRIEDLDQVYAEIAADLRIQYLLAYNPTNQAQDGAWRSIRVRVKNRPDAVARTRKGYYADKRSELTSSRNP